MSRAIEVRYESRYEDEYLAAGAMPRTEQPVNLATLLESLGEQLFSLPDVDGGAINLINESGDALVTAHLKLPKDYAGVQRGYQGFHYHLKQSDVNVMVFCNGAPEIVSASNLDRFADITRTRFERWRMRSLMVLPLTIKQQDGSVRPIGTVSVFSQHQLLDAALSERIDAIVDPHAMQVARDWTQHQIVERNKVAVAMSANMQQFFACVNEMNSLTSVQRVYALIASEFLDLFHFDVVSILLEEDGELTPVHTTFREAYRHLSESHTRYARVTRYALNSRDGQPGYVYTHNQHFLIDDVMRIMHLPMSDKDRIFLDLVQTTRTLLIVPIRLKDSVVGTITLITLGQPIHLSKTELTLIELLASFISTAIRNAKAHDLVEQKNSEIELLNQHLRSQMILLDQVARKDSLTGLNNFGNFEEELKRRASECVRAGKDSTLSVILLDVDHFKQFNDTHGHLAGNQVLQEVATRILKCARDMDFVARYGGEEFAMLLPQCDLADAAVIAERIRCRIADEAFIVDGLPHKLAISGGCAQFVPQESVRDFIYRVDAALYRAKRNGRDRIEIAPAGMAGSAAAVK